MTVAGQERPPQLTQYALDRKTRECVESNENWAYSPQIVMNERVGHYGPLFPGGLGVGDTLSAFFNDPAKAFEVKVAEKIEDFNGLGITVLKIDASRPAAEYHPAVAQAVLGAQGLPMELTFAQLSAQLKAKGLDLEALMAGLAAVAAPEDLQKLQAMTGQPVKVIYKQEGGDVTYIDQKTGATVGKGLVSFSMASKEEGGFILKNEMKRLGFYAQDALTIAHRATLHLGLRFDRSSARIPAIAKAASGQVLSSVVNGEV